MVEERPDRLRIQAYVILGALVLQYALGMYANLYVSFPKAVNPGPLWVFAWTTPATAVHIAVGTLLFVGAILFHLQARKRGVRGWIRASAWGLASILGAALSGIAFIDLQIGVFSYLMSLFFLAAFASYLSGLCMPRRSA